MVEVGFEVGLCGQLEEFCAGFVLGFEGLEGGVVGVLELFEEGLEGFGGMGVWHGSPLGGP